jgi:tetratricopeptide (TPR) repeat protein
MIEGALVYIFAAVPPNPFVGCGAVIEDGLVATCRHVWRDALAQAPDGVAPLVEFPRAKPAQRQGLVLADSCEGDDPPLDLVLLRPAAIPSGTPVLQLAMEKSLEVGEAASRARIRRDSGWIEATVSGRLDSALDPDGRRQFTGENRQGYFFVRGSSGSPVFCRGGQQLAAILSLSQLGANEGKSPLQEAFAVPATTIRRFRERMAAQPVAAEEGMDATDLRRLLDAIGAAGIPVQEIPARLRAFVEGARAHAAEPPAPTNAGGDIAAAIDTARAKLGNMDLAGARAGLSGKLSEEREARAQRLLPLLREQVAIARLSYAGEDLRQALQEIAGLTPEDAWTWIDLGDACQMGGNTAQALDAYRRARAAAEDAGAERDLSVSHIKIGDVLVAQGEGGAALAAYRAGMAIAERLAAADPGNAEWQRDLIVSCVKLAEAEPATARVPLGRALAVARALSEAGRLAPRDVWILEELERRLRALDNEAPPAGSY